LIAEEGTVIDKNLQVATVPPSGEVGSELEEIAFVYHFAH
jgi:hypothetical protein